MNEQTSSAQSALPLSCWVIINEAEWARKPNIQEAVQV